MKSFLAIFDRELRAYFFSPMGYVVLTFFLVFNGVVFSLIVGYLSDPRAGGSVTPLQLFFGGTFLFWLVLPVITALLTMRLVSEERRTGTIESLMTSPVSENVVILAKYLAALAFYAFLWLPTLAYVVIVERYSEVDWGPIGSGYIGLLGIGAVFLAVGILSSSLSRNQIVSALVAFVLSFLLFVSGFLEGLVKSDEVKDIVAYVNLPIHMEEFAKGIVDTRRLIFYVTTSALFLFLAARSLEAKKWR